VEGSDVDGAGEGVVWGEVDGGAAVGGSGFVVGCGFELVDDLHGSDFGCSGDGAGGEGGGEDLGEVCVGFEG